MHSKRINHPKSSFSNRARKIHPHRSSRSPELLQPLARAAPATHSGHDADLTSPRQLCPAPCRGHALAPGQSSSSPSTRPRPSPPSRHGRRGQAPSPPSPGPARTPTTPHHSPPPLSPSSFVASARTRSTTLWPSPASSVPKTSASSSLASTCAFGYEDNVYNDDKDQLASGLRSWCWDCSSCEDAKSEERRHIFAFIVGGNAKWVLLLAALLESIFPSKNMCNTHFGYRSPLFLSCWR